MKYLFLVSDFNQGGITSSLINLTNKLIKKGHIVHLLNLPNTNALPNGFNKNVKLIELDKKACLFSVHMEDLKKAKYHMKFYYLFLGVIKKLLGRKWYNICFSNMKFDSDYDAAIAFRQGPVDYYIAKFIVPSKKTFGFYHGDGITEGDTSKWDSCLSYMDKIAAVSISACDNLVKKYSEIKEKFCVVYNLFDSNTIKKIALKDKKRYESFEIVTVARIDLHEQKRQDRIVQISKLLANDNMLFHWTIVGGGSDLKELRHMIEDANLVNYIDCVGPMDNPYPYIKNADLFALTSTWESYGMVITESLILNTPVVAGYYPALPEVLDPKYGILAYNSVEGIYQAIKKMIIDKEFYDEIKNNCNNFKYDSDIAYKQFMELFND